MEKEEYTRIVKENYRSQDDLPQIVVLLKRAGASQIETLKAIREHVDITLRDLDAIIVNSPVWSHMMDINQQLSKRFFDEIDENE